MTTVESEVGVYKAWIADLEQDIEGRIVKHSHMVDDYEKLVTGDLRMLIAYRELLVDGLQALRDGRPHITIEFIERTLDAMDSRVNALRAR